MGSVRDNPIAVRDERILVSKLAWIIPAVCVALVWPKTGFGEPILAWMERKFSQFAQKQAARHSGHRRGRDPCARGALAVAARAAAQGARRVQLPACRGHLRSRAARESAAPALDFLRYISRHPASHVRVDVSAGARDGAGRRTMAGPAVDRRAAERCGHVHGVHLDAARVGAAGMGASRRHSGLGALWRVQLLDEQLLGRSGGGDRGCPSSWERCPGSGITTVRATRSFSVWEREFLRSAGLPKELFFLFLWAWRFSGGRCGWAFFRVAPR